MSIDISIPDTIPIAVVMTITADEPALPLVLTLAPVVQCLELGLALCRPGARFSEIGKVRVNSP